MVAGLRARLEAGQATAPDVLQAEIEQGRIEDEQRELERQEFLATTQLNVLMNRQVATPPGKLRDETLDPPTPDEGQLTVLMLESRPEIQLAKATLAAEKARLQLAERNRQPDPAISLSAQRYNDASQAVSQVGAGISIPLPWVNAGRYSAGIQEARERVAAAGLLQAVTLEAQGLLHDQLEQVATAHHHYELYRGELLATAQKAVATTQASYESGQSSLTDWLMAERTRRDLQKEVSAMSTDYQTAIADLQTIIGTEPNLPGHSPARTNP
ncbi:MAG: TolC family protein [Chthoniobacteraceae bacterium]